MNSLESVRKKTQEAIPPYLSEIEAELHRATESYGPINSPHEGYGIIKEELDEFWDEVKRNNNKKARAELIQVAAMCVRYLIDSEHWHSK